MTSDNWQRAKDIFNAALDLDARERQEYLSAACDGDEALRQKVEDLLGSYESDFMEAPAANTYNGKDGRLPAGMMLGRYEIVRLLGSGGMGEVYLAKDNQLDRQVAIKVLNAKYESNEANLKRFIQEAKAASALNHPNILTIHEIGEFDGSHYIVSEFVDGKTLREIIGTRRSKLSEVVDISIQIAGALSAAHATRIIHRDIKPENFVVRGDGYVKVLDFGLAKLLPQQTSFVGLEEETIRQNLTGEGLILGTVSYMSPEQARGDKIDERTDIFSLGSVIYEMISGRTPFEAESVSEKFANLINSEPPPLARFATDIPDELERIVSKTLRKDPDERYQTMKGLLADLKDLKQQTSANLDRVSTPERNKETAILPRTTDDVPRAVTESGEIIRWYRRPYAKGIIAAAALLALIGTALISYFYILRPSARAINSVAVLPLAIANTDPDTDFLSDGITDNIIERLSQVPGFKVASHSAVFHYKGQQIDPHAVGSELGVEAVLTGRLIKRNDSLTISLELVNAKDNSHIWGEQYDRKIADLLPMQREIPADVANQLRLRLTGEAQQRLTREYTNNAEAYQFYIKGRSSWETWTRDGSKQAVAFFKQALEKDPNYALAYAGLADAYMFGPGVGADVSSKEAHQLARNAATKALSLDPQLGEAHAALAEVLWFDDWDFAAADREFQQAITLSPSFAEGHHEYSHFLLNLGRINESLVESKRFLELDPVSESPMGHLAYHYVYARQYDAGLEQFQKTLQQYPDVDPNNHLVIGSAYYQKGMFREAVDEYLKGLAASGTPANQINDLRSAFIKSGIKGFCQAYIELAKAEPEAEQDRLGIGEMYARIGDKDEAFEWLEKAYIHHDDGLVRLKEELGYDNIRSDPRFADLLRRVGLPQ